MFTFRYLDYTAMWYSSKCVLVLYLYCIIAHKKVRFTTNGLVSAVCKAVQTRSVIHGEKYLNVKIIWFDRLLNVTQK